MPLLSFEVEADYSELIRLQQEIAKTKSQLQNFRPGQPGISIDALNKKLAESTARYRQLAQAAIRSGAEMEMSIKQNLSGIFTEVNRVQDLLTRPMMAVGGLAGVYGLGEFLSKITSIRGQFQQMNASIETMIGKRKGEKLNAELQEFAKISPLEFAPTVSTAQMMLGFGIDADKVPRYLQAIGDIAMGDTGRFQSLALAFSQMSAAGKLMGQDLMQMVNAGFQPLQVIAEKTGKSIGTLKEEMSKGKISAEMVQEAFIAASSEGGKYYNMSEIASKTIPGAIAKLNDSMDLMFNDIGQNMEGALVGVIDAASTIVENMGRIIPVLATAAAAFGVYKTSAMLSSFAAKQSVVAATKDIIDGFDAELAKIQEMQNAKLMEGYDDDIRKALEKGAIDETYANAIQQGRLWQQEQQRIADNERRIAEEAQRVHEEHLKDMQLKRENAAAGSGAWDDDIIQGRVEGKISEETAHRLQNERDYAQAVLETKDAALESANTQKAASDLLVEASEKRVQSAKELLEMAESAGDAEDKKAAAEEYMAAIEEQASAVTAQQTAQEAVNTAERERNSAVTVQQAIQKQTATVATVGDTTATNTNTTATNVNTTATNTNTTATTRGTIATALSTAKDKAATVIKYGLTAATDACKNAWNSLKDAMATNPIGMIVTALTTVIGLFMSWKSATEEASTQFGKSARESVDNLNLLYNVLEATDKTSKIHKETLEKVVSQMKEYGITINNESDILEQVNKNRERLIELLIEEGRQREIANNLADMQNSTKEDREDFEELAKALLIGGDNADEWKEMGAKIIAEDVERNADEITKLKETIESYAKAKRDVFADWTEKDQQTLDAAITRYDELVYGRANKLAEKYGSDIMSIRTSDMMGYASDRDLDFINNYTEALIKRNEKMKEYSQLQSESLAKTEQAQAQPEPYSAAGKEFNDLLKDIQDANSELKTTETELNNLNQKEVKLKVDKTEAEEAKKAVDKATEAIEKHSSTDGKTNIDSSDAVTAEDNTDDATTSVIVHTTTDGKTNIDASDADVARVKTEGATDEVALLDSISAEPVIKTTWIDNFINKLSDAWHSLMEFFGIEDSKEIKISASTITPEKSTGNAQDVKAKRDAAKAKRDAAIAEIYSKAKNAKTDKEFADARKALNDYKQNLDQNSAEYKKVVKAIEDLDKKDKSKKSGKSKTGKGKGAKDDPKQRAYEAQKAVEEEEKRQAELALEEKNRLRELEIMQMEDNSQKEIAQIKLNGEKKRQALESEVQKEADILEKNAMQQWLKGGKNRKEYQYYAQFSDEQLAQMREQWTNQAGENIGYNTQLSQIDFTEEQDIRKVQKEIADTMLAYLKEFGSFQQKRFAIEQEFAQKIADARNDAERKMLESQQSQELSKLDIEALKQQIDWGSLFGNFGTMLSDQVQPTIEKLEAITKTDDFRNSTFEEQKAIFEIISTLKNSVTHWDNNILGTLGNAVVAYQDALRANSAAVEKESQLRIVAGEKAEALRKIQEANALARQKGEEVNMDAENAASEEATIANENLAAAARETAQTTSDVAHAQQTLSTATNTAQEMFNQLSAGLQGLASGSLQGVWNGLNKLYKLFTGNDNLANKFGGALIGGITKLFGEDSKVGKAAAEALSSLGGPMMGEIVGMFFSILDILKDGIGNFIASLIDTVLGAVNGLLNSLLSGEIVTSVGKSVIQGVGNILDTISFGGFSSLMNKWGLSGESDKNLEKDIEKLSATNEALRKAVDNLASEMRDAATAEMGTIYNQQKADKEKSMKNTQEMMQRSGAAWSNGFMGIGGKKSSNNRINKSMTGDDWSRISEVVGHSVRSAADFWNLTSEQMAKVAQNAPELYAKIKSLADDGYGDAAQFMDDYIEYYKELEELEKSFRESLTDVSFDSVKDDFKSLLLDMESDSKDFANNWEKMMQQAVINSLMNSKYNERLKKWYENFSDMMNDEDGLTAEEQAKSKKEWDSIVSDAERDRNALRDVMGWGSGEYSQEASKAGVTTITEDTGLAIIGRMTAMQEAVESIKASESISVLTLADMTDELIQIAMEYSRFNVHHDNIERQLAKIHIELQTISENTGAIVKPIQTMQADIAEIKKNTKNL